MTGCHSRAEFLPYISINFMHLNTCFPHMTLFSYVDNANGAQLCVDATQEYVDTRKQVRHIPSIHPKGLAIAT